MNEVDINYAGIRQTKLGNVSQCWVLLGHRQRRWTNIKATLVNRPVGAVEVGAVDDDEMMAHVFYSGATLIHN